MSWTLCTSGAAVIKSGVNSNTDIKVSGSFLALWSDDAEGRICAVTRRDWVGDYLTVDPLVSGALADVSSSMIAMDIINYDMSGFTSRQEATTMLDVLYDKVNKGLSFLKDFKSNTIKDVE